MKIAIIGGDINGLYLAWKLSEKGHQVTVFDVYDSNIKDIVYSINNTQRKNMKP